MAKANKNIEEDNKMDINGVKEELKDYIDIKVRKSINEELERTNRRIIREKSRKLLFKDIIILLLLVVIGFLLFLMYKKNYFAKYTQNDNKNNSVINSDDIKEVTYEDLLNEYSYLLDSIHINEKSTYINDYYSGKLTNEIKNYLAFSNMDFSNIENESDYYMFDSLYLKNEYNKLFNDEYVPHSFYYLDNSIKYINKLDSYISDKEIQKNSSNIRREISDIMVDGDKVVFTCVEGVLINGHLFNIVSNNEIKYNNDSLINYSKSLNTLVYTFINGKLDSIK